MPTSCNALENGPSRTSRKRGAEAAVLEASSDHAETDEISDEDIIGVPGYRVPTNVHHGIYFAGERDLTPSELDLQYEFAVDHIYLIRGVDMQGMHIPENNSAEALALAMIAHGQATWTQLQRLTAMLPCDANLRWDQAEQETAKSPGRHTQARPWKFTSGAWVRGPMTGMHRNTSLYPWVTRALTGVIRTWDCTLQFSTCSLIMNVMASPHRDKHNHKQSVNLSLPCSEFQGGQLFVEDGHGHAQLQPGGVRGHIVSMNEATRFPPGATHASLPWIGNRLTLLAYHIRSSSRLCEPDLQALGRAGFCVGFQSAVNRATDL